MEYLRKGENVEYTADGWPNAWFSATVLRSPSPTENPPTAVVQCHHMIVSETDKSPLVETVEASLIRPAQAEDPNRPIEPYEVVDVFHEDLWWTGHVVSRDAHDDDVYVFAGEDPPDVLRVRRNKLRLHFDWDRSSHSWVKPPNHKKEDELSEFSPGMGIEYDVDGAKPRSTWRPAICAGKRDDGSQLALKYDFNGEIFWAPLSLVRPCPKPVYMEGFEVGQKVDAFNGELWTLGEISKVLKEKRYVVGLTAVEKKKKFDHSLLRPHVDWVNKQWVSSSPSKRKLRRGKSIASSGGDEPPKKKAVFANSNESPRIVRNEGESCKKSIPCKNNDESLKKSVLVTNGNESLEKSVSISIGDDSVVEDLLTRPLLGNQPLCDGFGKSQTNVNESGASTTIPFVKNSPAWGFLKGMGVFKRFPQNPNFLALPNEEKSEGIAIGHMITFANIVEKISKLNRNNAREDVQKMKNAVAEYEQFGFEVKEILEILETWMAEKFDFERLRKKVEDIEGLRRMRVNELEKTRNKRALLMEELDKIKKEEASMTEELTKITEERCLAEKEVSSHIETADQLVNFLG